MKAGGQGAVPISNLHRKLEIGNRGSTLLHLWLMLKQTQHPPWPLLPPCGAGRTCLRLPLPTRSRAPESPAFGPLSVWENPSGPNKCRGCSSCFFFFLLSSTKRILYFFSSLNFHPLYLSTQRDGIFGKIILSSTSTCDRNFKSRNLPSSSGKNKGPGSDLGPEGGEAAWPLAEGARGGVGQVVCPPRGSRPS